MDAASHIHAGMIMYLIEDMTFIFHNMYVLFNMAIGQNIHRYIYRISKFKHLEKRLYFI